MAFLKQSRQSSFCYFDTDFGGFFLNALVLIKDCCTLGLLILLCFLVPCITKLVGCSLAAEKGSDIHIMCWPKATRAALADTSVTIAHLVSHIALLPS